MSNKKPFEYIEDKIKLAAENNQPAFDEKAWVGMELLLDKEEKRKRPVFWLWLAVPLLLAGGLVAYQWIQPSSKPGVEERAAMAAGTDDKITTQGKAQQLLPADERNEVVPAEKEKATTVNPAGNEAAGQGTVVEKDAPLQQSPPQHLSVNRKTTIRPQRKMHASTQAPEVADASSLAAGEITELETPGKPNNNISVEPAVVAASGKTGAGNSSLPAGEPAVASAAQATDKAKADDKVTPAVAVEKKPVAKSSSKSRGFYVLASGGTDAGSVKLFSYANSSITPKYGVGAGYQFNNRWSVQTGFYVSNKKYVAGSGDYHPKKDSYWNMVNILSVKAACLVYEIPLTVKYTFIQQPAVSFYGAVGASSYIMKKEDYNYYYTRYDMPYEKYWEYTGNQHLFAALTFSMGVEKKIAEKFSLLAEPSFSIPVSGVGDGKVKLFSSSIQIGLKYFPFKKRN